MTTVKITNLKEVENWLKQVVRKRSKQVANAIVDESISFASAFRYRTDGSSLADYTGWSIVPFTMKTIVEPISYNRSVLATNIDGYSDDLYFSYNSMSSDLKAWVDTKFKESNPERYDALIAYPNNPKGFRVRSINARGYAPLGSPRRHFLGLAYNYVWDNRLGEFGLSKK